MMDKKILTSDEMVFFVRLNSLKTYGKSLYCQNLDYAKCIGGKACKPRLVIYIQFVALVKS